MRIRRFTIYGCALVLGLFIAVLCFAHSLSDLRVAPSRYRIDWQRHPTIVMESDDWGAPMVFARAADASQAVRSLPVEWQSYACVVNATLERVSDLERLFDLLAQHPGADGLPAVMTANYVLSGPDYEAIAAEGFAEYRPRFAPFVGTAWQRDDIIAKAKEGIAEGVWCPEYHGFIHMNPYHWLAQLRNKDEAALQLFPLESFGSSSGDVECAEYAVTLDEAAQGELVARGIAEFAKQFGYAPRSSIASHLVWQGRTERLLSAHGIKVVQAKSDQRGVHGTYDIFNRVLRKLRYKSADEPRSIVNGDRNARLGIVYLNRNVFFEPMLVPTGESKNAVQEAMHDIEAAWARNEPAIISTHRYNYVSLSKEIAIEGLAQLDRLLTEVRRKTPDTVFLTDWEVAQHYQNGYSVRSIENGSAWVVRNHTSMERLVNLPLPAGTTAMAIKALDGPGSGELLGPSRVRIDPHSTCHVRLVRSQPVNHHGPDGF